MKNTKSWDQLIKTRLSKKEIAEIKQEAKREADLLRFFQTLITNTVHDYIEREDIGLKELSQRLGVSSSYASKIRRGQANLTIGSLAHLLAIMGREAKDLFKN